MPDDARQQPDRRKGERARRGRRASDPVMDLRTHKAVCVNLHQLADYWGVNHLTLRLWARQGKIPAFKTPGGQTISSTTGVVVSATWDGSRRAIGIELQESHCEQAAKRLAQSVIEFEWSAQENVALPL